MERNRKKKRRLDKFSTIRRTENSKNCQTHRKKKTRRRLTNASGGTDDKVRERRRVVMTIDEKMNCGKNAINLQPYVGIFYNRHDSKY